MKMVGALKRERADVYRWHPMSTRLSREGRS